MVASNEKPTFLPSGSPPYVVQAGEVRVFARRLVQSMVLIFTRRARLTAK
jgi:hypothetical protein